MKTTKRIEKRSGVKTDIHTTEFYSLSEFYTYINNTKTNSVFSESSKLSSKTGSFSFTQTQNFEEATNLFKNGWSVKAKELETNLKKVNQLFKPQTKQRATYDMVGFQASVPRYLQGIPTSMINKKNVVQKQKVITLNKNISYSANITTEQIMESSLKALQIIQKIEAQGIRVNLNLIWGVKDTQYHTGEINILKIKLKSANERLNISKLAFPLVHPSMLRRLIFRFEEVSPTFTKRSYIYGYGLPIMGNSKYDRELLTQNNEYVLSPIIEDVEKEVENILK